MTIASTRNRSSARLPSLEGGEVEWWSIRSMKCGAQPSSVARYVLLHRPISLLALRQAVGLATQAPQLEAALA